MKKILGIVALVLLVGSPLLAEVPPKITYTLQLGGQNGAWTNPPGSPPVWTPATHEPTTSPLYDASSGVLTWSVRVDVVGEKNAPDNTPVLVGGASNLVWDLKLTGPDGNAVGPAFGLGNATTPGFYSTVNDGTDHGWANFLAPSAYPWTLDFGAGNPKGRLVDTTANNGPNMAQYTYPSTYLFYNAPGLAAPITDPAKVTAPSGWLKGMGAGYKSFCAADVTTERAGIGLGSAGGSCYSSLLQGQPLAEGQICVKGLPAGTYTLELLPGKGNNVLWFAGASQTGGDICMYTGLGLTNPGAFAIGVDSANVIGSSIKFTIAATTGAVAVTILPPEAVTDGAQWAVDGGAWQNSGTTLGNLTPGSHTVSFKDLSPKWTKPANVPVTVVVGATYSVPTAQSTYALACTIPVLQTAQSVATHAVAGDLGLPITVGTTTIETRAGGPAAIWLGYDQNIGGTPVVTASALKADGSTVAVGATATISSAMLKIALTGVPDVSCLTVTVNGVAASNGGCPQTVLLTLKVAVRKGDVNGDGYTDGGDMAYIRTRTSSNPVTAANCALDVNLDGYPDGGDMAACRVLSSSTATPACSN